MPGIIMAEVQQPAIPQSQPRAIPGQDTPLQIAPPATALPQSASANRIRNSHLALDTFSPVNQNGSFEFDRVLKSGFLQKRTRKTKAWKPVFLVLRPNYLSIYKDQNEDKLRHKIHLSDLTAVAFLKDPKQKRRNVFGLFTPSRNYHLEATTKGDAEQWVDLIRKEARIDEEEEEEMLLASPSGNVNSTYPGFDQSMAHEQLQRKTEAQILHDERLGSSSPEPTEPIIPRANKKQNMSAMGGGRRPSNTIEYSGNELVSDAEFSDTDLSRIPGMSTLSLNLHNPPPNPNPDLEVKPPATTLPLGRNTSQLSLSHPNPLPEHDPERVVYQGYLLYLRSKNGIRSWKNLWVVLRPRSLSFYKNDSEYSPVMILPMENVINVVEIDPLSRTKRYCFQVIGEEKSFKFCAGSEGALVNVLGACKSLLARRKGGLGA
ncbi:putative ph domain-containing protein [Botrytis cinerea BcDW1]|uniref:Putative ph domain-containing protein n=1 Tax=Botryotinia fuckeliana (strain BcDW1) TaxID=1290391 RepID=M7UME6_BOTF1|nr:putative ph domain-containing protein [Botrytis cinerea BcDW1]